MPRTFPAARTTAALLFVLALPAAALAGPQDTKVGETRIAYSKAGTVIRAEGAPTGKPAGTLPAGTQVRVLEVKLPWVRVSATVAGQPVEGWLRAFEAIEPEALQSPAQPPVISDAAAAKVSGRDVSAAGRQFDTDTENNYRASRADLRQAYLQVDAMERETAQMDPYDAVAFLMEGDIGRRGRDLALPRRLPAEPMPEDGGGGGARKRAQPPRRARRPRPPPPRRPRQTRRQGRRGAQGLEGARHGEGDRRLDGSRPAVRDAARVLPGPRRRRERDRQVRRGQERAPARLRAPRGRRARPGRRSRARPGQLRRLPLRGARLRRRERDLRARGLRAA